MPSHCIECGLRPSTDGPYCNQCFNETKICRRCQKTLSIFDFEKNQRSVRGKISRRGECKACRSGKKPMKSAERAEFETNNPPPPLNVPFSCPICQKTFTRQFTNDVVLDHNHHTGAIRGWICRMCNNSMGMMEDDVEILKRAIKWLEG
jgi:hypothetical protein